MMPIVTNANIYFKKCIGNFPWIFSILVSWRWTIFESSCIAFARCFTFKWNQTDTYTKNYVVEKQSDWELTESIFWLFISGNT